METPAETLRALLRETAAYLDILREGGFGYIDGVFTSVGSTPGRRPAARTGEKERAGGAGAGRANADLLKAELMDPYAHLSPPSRGRAFRSSEPRARKTATPPEEERLTMARREEALRKIAAAKNLDDLAALVARCFMCGLSTSRTNTVPGEGNPTADLVFIGEGPGYHEDMQGRPFVGRAGQLLDDMIKAMGFRRDEVFIGNIVKCRPPNNRDPRPEEMKACEPFLTRQLELLRPKVICALGRVAIQSLLRDTTPITRLRGKWRLYNNIPLMPTFHPAYLLRNPAEKRAAWEDLQAVMAKLKELAPGG